MQVQLKTHWNQLVLHSKLLGSFLPPHMQEQSCTQGCFPHKRHLIVQCCICIYTCHYRVRVCHCRVRVCHCRVRVCRCRVRVCHCRVRVCRCRVRVCHCRVVAFVHVLVFATGLHSMLLLVSFHSRETEHGTGKWRIIDSPHYTLCPGEQNEGKKKSTFASNMTSFPNSSSSIVSCCAYT